MSIFDRFRKPKNTEQRQFFPLFNQIFGTGFFSVEKNAAVDRVVSRIANTISTLPLEMYQWTSKGIQDVWSHPVAKLIKDPAVEETSVLFYQTLVRHILLKGNGYVYKHRNGKGEVVALEIIDPMSIRVERFEDGRKKYVITGPKGGVFTERDILDIPLPKEGYNGTRGVSPVNLHRDIIRQNDILQEFIALTLHQGVGSRLLVKLDKDQYKAGSAKLNQLVSEFSEYAQRFIYGQQNQGRIIVTPPSTDITTIELPDLVKTEICNLYDITCNQIYQLFDCPPEVISSKEIKYDSLEQKYQDFLRTAIHPLCSHIAKCFQKSLLLPEDIGTYFMEFNYDSLLDVDRQKKVESVVKEFHSGIISLDEARRRLNMKSVEDELAGETRWIPTNLVPLNAENIQAYLAKSKSMLGDTPSSASSQEDKEINHNLSGLDKNL